MSDKICFMLSEEMNQIEGFQKLVNGKKLSLLITNSNYFMNICAVMAALSWKPKENEIIEQSHLHKNIPHGQKKVLGHTNR